MSGFITHSIENTKLWLALESHTLQPAPFVLSKSSSVSALFAMRRKCIQIREQWKSFRLAARELGAEARILRICSIRSLGLCVGSPGLCVHSRIRSYLLGFGAGEDQLSTGRVTRQSERSGQLRSIRRAAGDNHPVEAESRARRRLGGA